MNIGIFDSGIGGLSVARTYLSDPTANIIYIADTANMPYGVKSPEHIQQISSTIVKFLHQHNVDLIVIACHTASILAGTFIKKHYSQIPLITINDTIIPQALAATNNDSIGIIATKATIQSNVYRKALLAHNKKLRIFEQACPRLAPSIEQYFDKPDIIRNIIDIYLHRILTANIDTLILGCTHYALIKDIIHSYAPNISLVLPDETLHNKVVLEQHTSSLAIENKHQFFVSTDIDMFEKKLMFFLHKWKIKNIRYTIKPTPWGVIPSTYCKKEKLVEKKLYNTK